MGSDCFDVLAPGRDVKTAFDKAREDAAYEYGHGGYTGTIAEKGAYVVVAKTPMLLADAGALVDQLMNDGDERIDDKWGPAGAIPVILGVREVRVGPFDYSVGGPSMAITRSVEPELLKAVTPLAGLAEGETIESVNLHSYSTPPLLTRPTTRRTNCNATVTVRKAPDNLGTEPDAWMFFGWASC